MSLERGFGGVVWPEAHGYEKLVALGEGGDEVVDVELGTTLRFEGFEVGDLCGSYIEGSNGHD